MSGSDNVVIFDLDNCLFDDSERIPLIDWSTNDPDERYRRYHEMAWADNANEAAVELLQRHLERGNKPIFVTARPDRYRLATRACLARLFGGFVMKAPEYHLYTRPEGDHRKSVDLKRDILVNKIGVGCVTAAYDDREDIVQMYRDYHINAERIFCHEIDAYNPPQPRETPQPPPSPVTGATAANILEDMAKTFRERNAVYGDNYKMVAKLMAVLFPTGVPMQLPLRDSFHLFELILVKLSRFAISELRHIDSIHDAGVYCAMIESIISQELPDE